ncbi:MAG: 50S ribosomal protein L14e [Candidatus Hydrothermarchaeales archaeon]
MAVDIGRVCVKLAGREAGKKCVIVDRVNKNFVLISGPEVKRRRCNIKHLEPTEIRLEIEQGISETNLKKALKKAKVSLEE